MLLDDIATHLASNAAFSILAGTATSTGTTSILKGIMLDSPAAPDTLIALYETPGLPTSYSFATSTGNVPTVYEQPSLQVLSRSTSGKTARSNAETAHGLLSGYSGSLPTSTGRTYLSIQAIQTPFLLQRDANNRPIIACNYAIRKTTG